jgi:hypothetical protein
MKKEDVCAEVLAYFWKTVYIYPKIRYNTKSIDDHKQGEYDRWKRKFW